MGSAKIHVSYEGTARGNSSVARHSKVTLELIRKIEVSYPAVVDSVHVVTLT